VRACCRSPIEWVAFSPKVSALRKRYGSLRYMKVFVVARRRGESRSRQPQSWPLARCGQACHAFPRSDGSPAAHGDSICHFARP
jgi:hypothetical protein